MSVRRTRVPRDPRVTAMVDAVLECREDGHLFLRRNEISERWRWPDRDVIVRTNECAHCTMVTRVKTIDENTGDLAVPTKLTYQKTYSPPPGTGRVSRAAVRVERTRRELQRNPLPQRRAPGPQVTR